MPKVAFFPKFYELPLYIRQKVERVVNAVGISQVVERCEEFCEQPLEKPCERNLFCWHQLLEFLDSIIEKYVKVVTDVFITSVSQSVSRERILQDVSFLEDEANVTELIAVLGTTLHLVESASVETRFAYSSIKSLANLLLHPNLQVCFLCLEIIHSVLRSRAKYRVLKFYCEDNRTFLERVSTLSEIWFKRGGLKLFYQILQGDYRVEKFLFPEREDFLYLSSSHSTEDSLEDSESDREEASYLEQRKISTSSALLEVSDNSKSRLLLLVEWLIRNEADKKQIFELVWNIRICNEISSLHWDNIYRLLLICLRVSVIAVLSERILHESRITSYFNKEPALFATLAKIAAGEVSFLEGKADYLLQRVCVECFSLWIDRNFHESIISACGMSSHQGLFPTLIRKEIHSFVRMDQLLMENSWNISSLVGWKEKKLFVESLFHFMERLTKSCSTPSTFPLSNAGLFPSMLLIFSSTVPLFSETVAQAARTWLTVLEHHSNLISVFRDSGGLNIVAERVFKEVCEDSVCDSPQDDIQAEESVSEYLNENSETQKIVRTTIAFRGTLPFASFIVIHDCLKLFMIGHGTSGGRYTRDIASNKFCKCLRRMIARPAYYGGDIFALAGKTVSQIAHSEPTTTGFLIEAGIADALIESLGRGIPCSNSALKSIPNLISALCLVPAGLEDTTFQLEDTAADIGCNFEELVRHVPTLKNEIVSAFTTFLSNSVKMIAKKKDKEETFTLEEYSDSENEFGGGPCTMRLDHHAMSHSNVSHVEGNHSEDIRVTAACVAAELFENFAKGNREIQAALMSRNCVSQLLSLRLGFVESRQSRKVSPYLSGLHSVVNALHRLESRHQETVFKQLMKVSKEDLAQFLDCGASLGDVWIAEEWTENVITTCRERRALQRKLFVFARRVCIDLQILTSLAKHSNFPLSAWNSQNASAFISSVAWAERLTRYHLSRTFADVQISVASSDSDLCDFSTARITHAAPFLEKPVDINFLREVCKSLYPTWDPTGDKKAKEEYKLKSSFQPFFYPRDSLKGLAWSLATFVAAVQPLYTVLCKKMNRSQRYTIRSSDDLSEISKAANSFAKALGSALSLHIMAAKSLFSCKVGSLVGKEEPQLDDVLSQLPASWTYLIGILGEIRATLFEGMNSRNSVPFTPLIVSFIENGGILALLQVLQLSNWTKEMFTMDKRLYQLVSQVRESLNGLFCISDRKQGDSLKHFLLDSQSLLRRYSVHSSAALVASTVCFNLSSGVLQLVHLLITHSGRILSDAANNNHRGNHNDRDYHPIMRWMFLDIFKLLGWLCGCLNESNIGNELKSYPASSRLMFDEYIYIVYLFQEMKNQMPSLLKTQEEFSRQHNSARRIRNLRIQQRFTESPLVAQLVEMGFSRRRAIEAVRRANTERLEYAMEVLLSLPEEEEEEESTSQPIEEEVPESSEGVSPQDMDDSSMEPSESMFSSSYTEENISLQERYFQWSCKVVAEEMSQLRSCLIGTKLGEEKIDTMISDTCAGLGISMELQVDFVPECQCSAEELKRKFQLFGETLKTCFQALLSGNCGEYSSFVFVMILRALRTKEENDETIESEYKMLANWTVQSIQKDSEEWSQADLIVLKCAILCTQHLGKKARQCFIQQNVAYYAASFIEQVASPWESLPVVHSESRPSVIQSTVGECPMIDMGLQEDKLCACLLLLNSLLAFYSNDRLLEVQDWIDNEQLAGDSHQPTSIIANNTVHMENPMEAAQPKMDALFRTLANQVDEGSSLLTKETEEMDEKKIEERVVEHILASSRNVSSQWTTMLQLPQVNCDRLMDACISLLRIPWHQMKNNVHDTTVQGCVQLLAALTEEEVMVNRFIERGGLHVLFSKNVIRWIAVKESDESNSLQVSSSLFSFRGLVRNLVQDAQVLEDGMKDSIRYILKSRSLVNPSFLIVHSLPMIAKNPVVYLKALARMTSVKKVGNGYKLELSQTATTQDALQFRDTYSISFRLRQVLQHLWELLEPKNQVDEEEWDKTWAHKYDWSVEAVHPACCKTMFYVLHDLVDTFPCVAQAVIVLSQHKTPSWIATIIEHYIGWNRKEGSTGSVGYAASLFLLSLLDREEEAIVAQMVEVVGHWLFKEMQHPRVEKVAGICRLVSAVQRLKVRYKLIS
ncbi:ubiquitin carboxyl-terminal hydrolase, partial [Galdieria sulphuraria]